MITIILYFFLGMVVVPILSGFVDLVLTFFEYLKSKMGVKIMKNAHLAEEQEMAEGCCQQAIGFQYIPTEEEEDFIEEDV